MRFNAVNLFLRDHVSSAYSETLQLPVTEHLVERIGMASPTGGEFIDGEELARISRSGCKHLIDLVRTRGPLLLSRSETSGWKKLYFLQESTTIAVRLD